MRILVGLAAAALLAGCATHQAAASRIISTDWSEVEALQAGTNVALVVRADEIRTGEIKSVTATGVTLREARGVRIISRGEIARVTIREPVGTRRWPNVIKGAAAGTAITALPAFIAGAMENGAGRNAEVQLALFGPAIGAAIGSIRTPEQTFRERIVYIRP